MYRFFRNSLVVATLALGVVPSTGLAQPPAKKDCSAAGDAFDRLVCRQGALADQMEYTADEVFADGKPLNRALNPSQIKQIKNGKAKAQRAASKHDRNSFKRQAKAEARGNKQVGHLLPFDPSVDDVIPEGGDGICDYEQGSLEAQCAALDLDDQGNLQICNPEKKNKGKGNGNPKFAGLECDRSIDSDEAESPEEELDMVEAAVQLEANYDATEDNLIEMNTTLEIVNADLEAGPSQLLARSSDSNGCDVPFFDNTLLSAAGRMRTVTAGLAGAARIAADVSGQDTFGFNAQAVAAVFDYAAMVAELSYIGVELERQRQEDDVQDAIMVCVNQSQKQISDSQGQIESLTQQIAVLETTVRILIGEVKNQMTQDHAAIEATDNANKDTIVNEVGDARKEVVDLLRTPEGQRITGN